MSNKGFILPIFFIFTISFALTSSFLIRDFYRIFRISGFYRIYLKNDKDFSKNLATLNFKNSTCNKLSNKEICATSNNTNINYSFLSNNALEILNCSNDLILNDYLNLNIFSNYSIKSTKVCSLGITYNNSTKIKGNLASDQIININTKNLFIDGFLLSPIILHKNQTEIITLGDVYLPSIACSLSSGCELYIASISGKVLINFLNNKINLNIYAKNGAYTNGSYHYWNVLKVKELAKLPISIDF